MSIFSNSLIEVFNLRLLIFFAIKTLPNYLLTYLRRLNLSLNAIIYVSPDYKIFYLA